MARRRIKAPESHGVCSSSAAARTRSSITSTLQACSTNRRRSKQRRIVVAAPAAWPRRTDVATTEEGYGRRPWDAGRGWVRIGLQRRKGNAQRKEKDVRSCAGG
ncbi:hypothetical protein QYE76_001773 [Lolium multiflorum]|uniref:Uncharacterized protein n=1 Tax=Lolium multiflorum TaxID=4521 RepID=A0AAD8RLZ9_LOLMU|nr:hypothetical protein QYE76_001773 [Lolium multiflorum]